jgi:hypothetical protein
MTENPGRRAPHRDFATWALALLCVGALAWAAYECWRARAAAVGLAGLQDLGRQAESQFHEAEAAGRADLRKTAILRGEMLQFEPGASRPKVRFSDSREASRQFLAAHPEAQQLADRIMRELGNSWPRTAGRAAGFSQAQLDAYAAMFARQKGYAPFVVDGIRVPTSGDLGNVQVGTLKQLVGDDLYAKYNASLNDGGAHSGAAGIARTAEALGTPLSSEQNQALAKLLTSAQAKPGYQNSIDWEAVEQQAAAFLSQPQIEALKQHKALWDQMRVEQKYSEAFMAAAKSSPP